MTQSIKSLLTACVAVLATCMVPGCSMKAGDALHLEQIKLPPGFRISVYATGVSNAREMALGAKGTVFVGSRTAGNVYAVTAQAAQSGGAQVIRIATGLNMPSGVAYHDGALYVAEVSRVIRFDNIENQLQNSPKPV